MRENSTFFFFFKKASLSFPIPIFPLSLPIPISLTSSATDSQRGSSAFQPCSLPEPITVGSGSFCVSWCRRVMPQWHDVMSCHQRSCPFGVCLFFFPSAAQKMSLLNSSFALGHVLLTFILLVLSIYTFPAFKNNHVQFLFSKERRKILPQIPKQNGEKNLDMIRERTLGLSFILLLSKFILWRQWLTL